MVLLSIDLKRVNLIKRVGKFRREYESFSFKVIKENLLLLCYYFNGDPLYVNFKASLFP